jgi:hypothetical protein
MQRPPVNDLPLDQQESSRTPSRALGFARSQEFRPTPPDEANRIIEALGTHNVIGRTFSFFASTASQPILNANPKRVGFTVQNISGSDIYVGIGTQPSVVGSTVINGILIQNGGFYEPQNSYIATNDIFVLGIANDLQLTVIELTKLS